MDVKLHKGIRISTESERAPVVKNLDFQDTTLERALGVQWNVTSDNFGYKITIKDMKPSRRGILSTVSSIYDPLGFAAPCILPTKAILQDLCHLKVSWDDEIPNNNLLQWKNWLYNLPNLENYTIDCSINQSVPNLRDSEIRLHHSYTTFQMHRKSVTMHFPTYVSQTK